MNEESRIFDLIERYHQGLLSEVEKKQVEERMQRDASFAEYVTINGLANEVVYAAGMDMLRERMTADIAVLDQKIKNKNWKIGMGIAALAVLLVSLVYVGRNADKKNSSQPELPNKKPILNNSSLYEKVKIEEKIFTRTQEKIVVQPKEELNAIRQEEDNSLPAVSSLKIKTDSSLTSTISLKKEYKQTNQQDAKSSVVEKCDLSFHAIVNASCKGEMNGSIILDKQSLLGGTAPYYFLISNSSEKSSNGVFSELKNGAYTITMHDSKACSYAEEVMVPEKNCTLRKSESFSPEYGEVWKAPTTEGEAGLVSIYNKAGITIFKGNFTAQRQFEWNGTTAQGVVLEAGLYVCAIQYENGKTELIDISIIR